MNESTNSQPQPAAARLCGTQPNDLDPEFPQRSGWQLRVWTDHPREPGARIRLAMGVSDRDVAIFDGFLLGVTASITPYISITAPDGQWWAGMLPQSGPMPWARDDLHPCASAVALFVREQGRAPA